MLENIFQVIQTNTQNFYLFYRGKISKIIIMDVKLPQAVLNNWVLVVYKTIKNSFLLS